MTDLYPFDADLVAALLSRLAQVADSASADPEGMNLEDLIDAAWFGESADEDEPSIHPMSPAVAVAAVRALVALLMGDPVWSDPSGREFRRIACPRIENALNAVVAQISQVQADIQIEIERGLTALLPHGGKVVRLRPEGGES